MNRLSFCLAVLPGFFGLLLLAAQVTADQPNIVFINLDDADRDMFRRKTLETKFPGIYDLAKKGTTFTNFYVCSPKCGPSRACLMRGQYAHAINHRTNENSGPPNRGFTGGFTNYVNNGFHDDDFGRWMKSAGYETVFVGKHVNGAKLELTVPAGWDHFYQSRGSEYYITHRFTNRDRSNPSTERTGADEYRTDVEVDDIVRIISNDLSDTKPFLIYFAPFGPHTEGKALGGMIDTNMSDLWPNVKATRQADYNEKNNADKPLVYRQLPPLSFESELEFQVEHRKRMLATKSVDNGIQRIVSALKANGLYDNTLFFITSDNGFALGQHRFNGKGSSLSRSSHVPLIVVGPGIPVDATNTALTTQIDLAPTFLEIAGASSKPFFDGKSLVPILFSNNPQQSSGFRDGILVENWESTRRNPYVLNTTFTQLKTQSESYTEWADGSIEYYNHTLDPLELRNMASQLSGNQILAFRSKIAELRRPMPEPLVTIESPDSDFTEFIGPPFSLRGVAEDSDRISRVEIVLLNEQTREYWNGSSWQEDRVVQQANLANPNGILCEWSLEFSPPEPNQPKESYVSIARAFSTQGNFTRNVTVRRFKYDSLNPVTTLAVPRVRPNKRVFFSGTATDNLEIKHVEIVIQNRITKKYFSGTHWVASRTGLRLIPDEDGTWEWTSPIFQDGSFVVRARAIDEAGNFEPQPLSRTFTVE